METTDMSSQADDLATSQELHQSYDNEDAEKQRTSNRLSHFAACAPCRKRKLRCDGIEPVCGTCLKASRQCLYQDIRKGVRKQRTSIKILEARLAELESKRSSTNEPSQTSPKLEGLSAIAIDDTADPVIRQSERRLTGDIYTSQPQTNFDQAQPQLERYVSEQSQFDSSYLFNTATLHQHISGSSNLATSPSSGELISLGLEEPLPLKEMQDELNALYFSDLYRSMPAIHPARYLAACSLPASSNLRPPHCLCYAIWALAALSSDRYRPFHDIFYRRARKYAELDEMKSQGEVSVSVAHVQTWVLIGVYEGTNMYLARGWISARKAVSLVFATGLHKLDGVGVAVSNIGTPATDWIELEQRRRTFWMTFIQDKFLSTGSGLPVAIDERDVQTNLPMPNENYENGIIGRNMSFAEATSPVGARNVSSFAATAVIACLLGRVVTLLHRPEAEDSSVDDLDGQFWTNYRKIDKILLNAVLRYPEFAPSMANNAHSSVKFLNLAMQCCVIALHQAGLFTAGRNPRLADIRTDAKSRCMTAARSMADLLRTISEPVLLRMGPYTSFCIYMAARVHVLALREAPCPGADQIRETLRFLVSVMQMLKKTRPYTAALIMQLDIDVESLEDSNPAGHIMTVQQSRDSISKNENGTQKSPITVMLNTVTRDAGQNSDVGSERAHQPSVEVRQQSVPLPNSSMNNEPFFLHEQPHLRPDVYSDHASNYGSDFMSSNTDDRVRATSMPMDYSTWTSSAGMMFSMTSLENLATEVAASTSMPMDLGSGMQPHVQQDFFDTTAYNQMDGSAGLAYQQPTAEWQADLTWNYT